jgi:transposase
LPVLVQVGSAAVGERDGAAPLLAELATKYPTIQHLWADQGYKGPFIDRVKEETGITLEIVKRPDGGRQRRWMPADAPPIEVPAFQVAPRRWVVERTFAWLGRYRRLSKDYEYLVETSVAVIYAAMTGLLLRRLTRKPA